MRVSPQTKLATRRNILDVALRLFADHGFDATTTRDIARAAGIASGTLFNYFPTKEAVVATLVAEASAEAIAAALAEAEATAPDPDGLEESLFALVAAGLRKLKPLRKFLPALLDTTLSPLALGPPDESAALRVEHLGAAAALAARHGHGELSPVALQLYWTLYTGVLVFWANDSSPKQEDTLALLDDSINMFVTWLREHARPDHARPGPAPTAPPTSPDLTGARHAHRRPTDEGPAGAAARPARAARRRA